METSGHKLVVIWTFAAFGEELSYRGYLLRRAADSLGHSNLAYLAAMILVSVLFGFGHYYKGPSGVLDSTYLGWCLAPSICYLGAIFGLRSCHTESPTPLRCLLSSWAGQSRVRHDSGQRPLINR